MIIEFRVYHILETTYLVCIDSYLLQINTVNPDGYVYLYYNSMAFLEY